MEKVYIGTKIISAEPMEEVCFFAGKPEGWPVGKPSRPGYKVRYEDGYVSWSPKETFERAYRLLSDGEMEMFHVKRKEVDDGKKEEEK